MYPLDYNFISFFIYTTIINFAMKTKEKLIYFNYFIENESVFWS